MEFCREYPQVCERFDRFWEGADTDRPLLYVTAPREKPDASVPVPKEVPPEDRVRPEFQIAWARYMVATNAYLAEGYPHFFVNFGPGVLHACIGGEADFSSWDTTWFPQFLPDVSEFTRLRFDPEGRWWTAIRRSTEALLEEVGDQVVVATTDIGGAADVLASAVGTEQLLLDAIERPEAVKEAVDHCHEMWMEAYEANCALLAGRQDVTAPWWPILSRGRTYMTQCDFNAMISPKVFTDLFADELGRIFSKLDQGAFHLDGIGTEVHVPALLAQPNLKCIQWVPKMEVHTMTSPLRHAKMLRQIQEAGVGVTFNIARDEVEAACRELDPRRLFLRVDCRSEQEAKGLIENTLRWCEGR